MWIGKRRVPGLADGVSAAAGPVAAGKRPPGYRLLGFTRCLLLVIVVQGPPSAASPPADPLVFYDMTSILEWDRNDPEQLRAYWDHAHLVTSLQGLVNRHGPRLFVRYIVPPDDFWWQVMTADGGWLAEQPVRRIESLESLLAHFRDEFQGYVVWDPRVPATSNLASTLAGCDDLLCLRYDQSADSLYQRVRARQPLPETRLLAEDGGPLFTGSGDIPGTELPSSGSAKCDAYLWLIEHYVRTGRANPRRMGHYLDAFWLQCWFVGDPRNNTLTNHDYLIAHRGIVWDLHVWDDESPVDDPTQPAGTDAATLRHLLHAANEQLGEHDWIQVAGFTPWAFKYTNYSRGNWNAGGGRGGVETEWRLVEILSCFNAYLDADALGYSGMSNASFFQHYPLAARYPQPPRPSRESLTEQKILDATGRILPRHYYAHYVGDYDAAAWLYHQLPRLWTDPQRGSVPLSWAFNPNLAERFPLGMAWTRKTASPADRFIAGNSGAGYLNPGLLLEPRKHSDLPNALARWERHCRRGYDQWDLSITGFVIDGFAPAMPPEVLDAYARFSPDGLVAQKVPVQGLHQGMPYLRMSGDLPREVDAAARMVSGRFVGRGPRFSVYRSILRSPSWYRALQDQLEAKHGEDAMLVDYPTLMWLVREYEQDPGRHAPPPSRWKHAAELVATPAQQSGAQTLYWPDGAYRVETRHGQLAWVLPGSESSRYLYFYLDDDFCASLEGPVSVQVEYGDMGTGSFLLEYDSRDPAATRDGAYKASQVMERTGTLRWLRHTFRLADPRLSGRQNGQADLRIASRGDDLLVRRVVVRRDEPFPSQKKKENSP